MTDAPIAAPAAEPSDSDELDSYLEYRPNGGMHLVIEGVKRRMRTPRMRDYRYLAEAWREAAEAIESRSEELQAFLERLMAEGDKRAAEGLPRVSDADRAQDRAFGVEIRTLTENATLAWWVQVLETLGITDSDRACSADDLPVFLTSVDAVNKTIDHWRSVPSRSGVR